ncbi:MAG: tetratricopeptide repeat protein [Hormoscilla sp. GM102CHS1]|nr:tetratricopeptide repeat protein [Hormoscilla sp. GM102CHS1]
MKGQKLLGLTLAMLVVSFAGSPRVSAKKRDRLPPSPLEIAKPDPLLPQEPMSPREQQDFLAQLDGLHRSAMTQLDRGNRQKAFEIWYRELRLRRSLGPMAEVEALGRVGAIAWAENRSEELLVVKGRLQSVQEEATLSQNMVLLNSLGSAYEQMRSPDLALAVYEEIIADARGGSDRKKIAKILNKIGQLHLSWFDYVEAATAYRELLALAMSEGDRASQLIYGQQLGYIYDRGKMPERAIEVKNQLIELYLQAENLTKIPELQIGIGSDHVATGNMAVAAEYYQAAYELAESLQQFSDAGIALSRLGQLYRESDRAEFALAVYKQLLYVNDRSYDMYGKMKTYDRIGKIHVNREEYAEALEAFKEGLELAAELRVDAEYFIVQIDKVRSNIQG